MLDEAYRLVRATAAVAQGVTRPVFKVHPEDSVIVLEGTNRDGNTVNVRCGTENLWMFARDLMERCRSLSRPEIDTFPADLNTVEVRPEEGDSACWSSVRAGGADRGAHPICTYELSGTRKVLIRVGG